jgi:hypothetical protein
VVYDQPSMHNCKLIEVLGVPLLIGALGVGCHRTLAGASLMDAARVPQGRLVASYTRTGCSDNVLPPEPAAVLDHMVGTDGGAVLVERGANPPWMVFTNSFVDGREVVFQATQGNTFPRSVWEFRVPADGQGPGRFIGGTTRLAMVAAEGSFRVEMETVNRTCALARVNPTTGQLLDPTAASPTPAAVSGAVDSGGSALASSTGWGYDGDALKTGDRILIDSNGRATSATVIKASGGHYFVMPEGSPSQSGIWVPARRVIGRVR